MFSLDSLVSAATLEFLFALSIVGFVGSLIAIPWILVRLPQDYFSERHPRRSEEHTSELQSPCNLVCRLLLEKKKKKNKNKIYVRIYAYNDMNNRHLRPRSDDK